MRLSPWRAHSFLHTPRAWLLLLSPSPRGARTNKTISPNNWSGFCFAFNLEGTLKTIEKELLMELLPMAICGRSAFTDKFLAFVAESSITRIRFAPFNRADFSGGMAKLAEPRPSFIFFC